MPNAVNVAIAQEAPTQVFQREIPVLAPLLDSVVFAPARVGERGLSVVWLSEAFGADSVGNWAKKQACEVGHEVLGIWIHRNGLRLAASQCNAPAGAVCKGVAPASSIHTGHTRAGQPARRYCRCKMSSH